MPRRTRIAYSENTRELTVSKKHTDVNNFFEIVFLAKLDGELKSKVQLETNKKSYVQSQMHFQIVSFRL